MCVIFISFYTHKLYFTAAECLELYIIYDDEQIKNNNTLNNK